MPRKYDVEFKARAVRLVRDHLDDYGSVTAASVAVGAQLGVNRDGSVWSRTAYRRLQGCTDLVGGTQEPAIS